MASSRLPRDDDEISLTSTISEQYDEDQEFLVDRVLAEKSVDGKPYYLLKWEDYPIESSTWEPQEHITPEVILAWRERKKSEQRNPSERFEVEAFEAKQKELADAKASRQERRKAKRKRLGLPVSASASESEFTTDSDSGPEDIVRDTSARRNSLERKSSPPKKKIGVPLKVFTTGTSVDHLGQKLPKSPSSANSPISGSSILLGASINRDPRTKKSSAAGTGPGRTSESTLKSPLDTHASDNRRLVQKKRAQSSSDDEPLIQSRSKPKPIGEVTSNRPRPKVGGEAPSMTSAQHGSVASIRGISSTRGGRAATRGAIHKNVFAMGRSSTSKSKANLASKASSTAQAPRLFANKRLEWRSHKQGREKADAAPDISALPGGLFDPSAPSSMQPLKPGALRKGANEAIGGSDLFVLESDTPDRMVIDRPAPRVPAPTYQQGTFVRSTCYYWDKQQRMPDTAKSCERGSACDYIHGYREGAPVATPPPSGSYGSRQPTCFFWNKHQQDKRQPDCTNGAGCQFLHEYKEGVEVASAPLGYVPPRSSTAIGDSYRPDSSVVQSPTSYLPPTSINRSRVPTCYFWNRNQQDNTQPGCTFNGCGFLHEYQLGVSVAQQPIATYESSSSVMPPPPLPHELGMHMRKSQPALSPAGWLRQSTCFFWDMYQNRQGFQSCSKRDEECTYFHEYMPGMPVSGPPKKYSGPYPTIQGPPEGYFQGSPQGHMKAPSTSLAQSPRDSISSEITKATSSSSRPVSNSGLLSQKEQFARHSPQRAQLQPETSDRPPWDPERPYNAVCYLWLKDKCEHISETCQYQHVDKKQLPISPVKRPTWDLSMLYQSICWYFWAKGACRFESGCPFRHTMAVTLPLSPAPSSRKDGKPDRSICRQSITNGVCLLPFCTSVHPVSRTPTKQPEEELIAASTQSKLKGAKSVKFIDEGSSSTDIQQFSFMDTDSDITLHSPQQRSINTEKPRQKMDMKDYQVRKVSVDVPRGKDVFLGSAANKSLLLDFSNINNAKSDPWKEKWTKIESIRFAQKIVPQDFQAQQSMLRASRLQELPGNVLPGDLNDVAVATALQANADEMFHMAVGLVAIIETYSLNTAILIYPAKMKEWQFLEGSAEHPSKGIRYTVFSLTPGILKLFSTRQDNSLVALPYKSAMIKRIHGLDLTTFLPKCNEEINPYNFFLLFPETAEPTEDFIATWIKSAPRDKDQPLKLISSRHPGAWKHFITNLLSASAPIKAAVVFIHESVVMDLFQLPSLYEVVNTRNVSFWCMSDSDTPYPLYPSHSLSIPGTVRDVRLFPRGCLFFVTPSFLVAEPKRALQLFQWFLSGSGSKWKISPPRTWKLVACYKLSDYVQKLAIAKLEEKDDFEAKNHGNPMKDALLKDRGINYETCEIRLKLHNILVQLDSQELLESYSDSEGGGFESDTSEDCDRPFIYADKNIDPNDEPALVRWFVAYSIRKLDRFKKYIVVGTNANSASRATRTIEEPVASNKIATAPRNRLPNDTDTVMGSGIERQNNVSSREEIKLMNTIGVNSEIARALLLKAGNNVSQAIANHNTPSTPSSETPHEMVRTEGEAARRFSFSTPGLSTNNAAHHKNGTNSRPGSSGSNRPSSSGSNTSQSGITTSATGQRFVPRSVCPLDQSLRKEINIKPGFTPIEDVERYRHPNSAENSPPGSRRDSGAMDIDSGPDTPSQQLLDEQPQQEILKREIRFEATTEWYRKMVERQGYAWEHVFVEGFEKAFKQLDRNGLKC